MKIIDLINSIRNIYNNNNWIQKLILTKLKKNRWITAWSDAVYLFNHMYRISLDFSMEILERLGPSLEL